jgi:hypothetical protein
MRADPHDRLVLPTGAPTGNKDLWEDLLQWQATFKPMVERIRFLAGHGLSSMMVLPNFLLRRIAPLQARVRPAWQYTGKAMPDGLSVIRGPIWPRTCRGPCWGS